MSYIQQLTLKSPEPISLTPKKFKLSLAFPNKKQQGLLVMQAKRMFKGMQKRKKCSILFNMAKKSLKNPLPCPTPSCFSTTFPHRAQENRSISERKHTKKVKDEQVRGEDFPITLYSYGLCDFLLCV